MGKTEGSIFDIRRFSTHDGDGIRTTMFFKGCPLSCIWCHNPEGIDTSGRPVYFKNKCIQCNTCCALSKDKGMVNEGGKIMLYPEKKENWGQLVNGCPTGALVWDSKKITVDEAVSELLKDEPFFKYGGGVTLSGGEPLLQGEFVLELLKELKVHKIHTAVETALYVPTETLKAVLPYLDLIYVDMKLFDEAEHIKYTGVSNERIKKHIKLLLKPGKKEGINIPDIIIPDIIIRTPLIPGITAKDENIARISRYIFDLCPNVSYELLNYNPLAEAKYHLIGKRFCFEENPDRYPKEEMQRFARIATVSGVKNVILE